jgi:hypothetical protein
MNDTLKIAIVLASLAVGASPTMAAPAHHHRAPSDPWVEPIHLDNTAVPAKQFFEEMQRDGE